MLKVGDIMHAPLVTVEPDMPVRQLARLLADEEISGTPVVDGNGALLGVVSVTDIVRLAAEDADVHITETTLHRTNPKIPDPDNPEEPEVDPLGFFLPEDSPYAAEDFLNQFAESDLDMTRVGDIMTPVAFSVGPATTVTELADFLVRGRIHRAIVVDGERPVGIVTSGDVLQAVADGRIA